MLVREIQQRRFEARNPRTFISYGEALDKLGIPRHGMPAQQLLREGLEELNEWLKANPQIPTISGLIISKQLIRPGQGFARFYGRSKAWEEWWLDQTSRAIDFDWAPYVERPTLPYPPPSDTPAVVREGAEPVDYCQIITVQPGKRGGKPCIRGMRITVADVLGWLAAGMSHQEIRSDFPELTEQDTRACLAYAAEKESHAAWLRSGREGGGKGPALHPGQNDQKGDRGAEKAGEHRGRLNR